jgi:hypothetical protein
MQSSPFKISRNAKSAVSLRMIEVELTGLDSFYEDVNCTLDTLYSLAKNRNLIVSKSKPTSLYNTQVTLCKVLDDLVKRLKDLHSQLLVCRKCGNLKNELFQLSQDFQQLKTEIDLFREMHFRVKRNCMRNIHNFPQLTKMEAMKLAA